MSKDKTIRIGVFGGSRGVSTIHILARYPDAELAAVCDKSKLAIERCRSMVQFGALVLHVRQ